MLAVTCQVRSEGILGCSGWLWQNAAAACPQGYPCPLPVLPPCLELSCWNRPVWLFSSENRLGLCCKICSWAGGSRALVMIHFPPCHHLLSVLVRLPGFVEAGCMQIQITFPAKGSRRLFPTSNTENTNILSAHCSLKSRL